MACACMRRPPSACAFTLARLRAPAQPALPHECLLLASARARHIRGDPFGKSTKNKSVTEPWRWPTLPLAEYHQH